MGTSNSKTVTGFGWDKELNSAMNKMQYLPIEVAVEKIHPLMFAAAEMFIETKVNILSKEMTSE